MDLVSYWTKRKKSIKFSPDFFGLKNSCISYEICLRHMLQPTSVVDSPTQHKFSSTKSQKKSSTLTFILITSLFFFHQRCSSAWEILIPSLSISRMIRLNEICVHFHTLFVVLRSRVKSPWTFRFFHILGVENREIIFIKFYESLYFLVFFLSSFFRGVLINFITNQMKKIIQYMMKVPLVAWKGNYET